MSEGMQRGKIIVKRVIHETVDEGLFECGLTLRELSRRSGLDVAYLSRVRNGKSPITEVNLNRLREAIKKGAGDEQTTVG